ncbi:MAG TPA: FUSC family protein [Acidocella sp.]|jgi:uncharacterized membrane protein YgaE (UPF0421/DUF939 family)|nr:FUSC family protein [Acidocella sp.]
MAAPTHPAPNSAWAGHLAFVIRCAVVAALSYFAASDIGLGFPAWAAISGLVVSQDRVHQTHHAMRERFIGTVIGVLVAALSGTLLARAGLSAAIQMAVAVGICAAIVRRYPRYRACMWTCPAVFLTTASSVSILRVGFDRGAEVIIGGVIAGVVHLIADKILLNARLGRDDGTA